MLLREWRGGQLPLIALATALSVTIIAAVSLVADRVERGLLSESASFLAADLALDSGIRLPDKYMQEAQEAQLKTAVTAYFPSMVYYRDTNHLAAVKAVSDNYPLRGNLTVSDEAFAVSEDGFRTISSAPEPGEVWVDERLLPLLGAQLGDLIEVGRKQLKMTQVIISEPDRGTGFSLIGARVLMNFADLKDADLIKEGSQIGWRLLIAGTADRVNEYEKQIERIADPHVRPIRPDQVEERLGQAVGRGRSFLILAGIVGLLLSGLVLALTGRRYAEQQTDRVALMKCWGCRSSYVRSIYLLQILVIGLVAALAGTVLGWVVHLGLLAAVHDLLPASLPEPGWLPLIIAFSCAPLCLAGFVVPSIYHLPGIPPLKVLRRDLGTGRLGNYQRVVWGVLALLSMAMLYSGQWRIPAYFFVGLIVVVIAVVVIGMLLFRIIRQLTRWSGSGWRLGVANLLRYRDQTVLQMIAFGIGIMLLLVITAVRTSLLDEWQLQIPESAPNHFLINVENHEREGIGNLIAANGLTQQPWYPMLRSRLISINGEELTEQQLQQTSGVNREVNLSWSRDLPAGNRLVSGQWWSYADQQLPVPQVSVEQEIAGELNIEVGDFLLFSLAGINLSAEVRSIRNLNWNSMNPNFFFIFAPGVLEKFETTWITSAHIPRDKRLVVSKLLKTFPTVLVISLEEALKNIRSIIDQASSGLQLIFVLILLCGLLVFIAATAISFEERARQLALLRTLGASRRLLLGATLAEFAALGLVSGLVAAAGAEACLMLLQYFTFELQVQVHPWLWLAGTFGGMAVVAMLGILRIWPLFGAPPIRSLLSRD